MTEGKIAILCGFIVLSVCFGCRSVDRESRTETSLRTALHDSTTSVWSHGVDVKELLLTDSQFDETTNIDITFYYPPDSAGVQSIAAKGKVQRNRSAQHSSQELHEKDDSTSQTFLTDRKALQQRHSETAQKQISKVKNGQWKFYLSVGCFFIFLLLIYKYRKWLH